MRRTAVCLVCAVAASGAWAIELASYPQVFSAARGAEVTVAQSVDGKEALIRIAGVNHAVDKVVFMARLVRWGGGTEAFVTTIDGRDSGMVQKRTSAYGGGERYVAFLPGRKEELNLSYDEAKSKALKPSELLATYERQNQQGVQQKLARFDREKHLANTREKLAEIDQDASAACGVPVTTSVDWAAIDDDRLKKLSVHSFCGAPASGLGRMCRDEPASFKPKAGALAQITCQFGPEMKARAGDRKVVFTTDENAPNQDDFLREFFRNQ